MSHLNAIRDDSAYAKILENWDANFYAKFTDVLRQAPAGSRILDAGCGVGQVVGRLMVAGYELHGVDVAEPNIQKAQKISPRCQLYDGKRLPYPDRNFSAAHVPLPHPTSRTFRNQVCFIVGVRHAQQSVLGCNPTNRVS